MSLLAVNLGPPLLRTVYLSVAASVLVATVFALAIYGYARAADMRRAGRGGAELAYGGLALLATLICVAAAVYAVFLVGHKS